MCSANSRSKQRVYIKLLTQRDAVQRRSVNRQEKSSLIVAPRAYNQPQPIVVTIMICIWPLPSINLVAAFVVRRMFECIGEKPNRKLRVGTFTQGMSVAWNCTLNCTTTTHLTIKLTRIGNLGVSYCLSILRSLPPPWKLCFCVHLFVGRIAQNVDEFWWNVSEVGKCNYSNKRVGLDFDGDADRDANPGIFRVILSIVG